MGRTLVADGGKIPWQVIDYRVNPPYLVTPGVLRHGRYTLFSLSPQDAQKVLDLIHRQRATTR